MARIEVDGIVFEAREGENLLQACLSQHLDLPYFCWHPSLGSVGACRQCAVIQYDDEEDERGRLVMACMTPVQEGARFSVDAPGAAGFRASVIEWLMENHPHDCPVCEEGGECHLQDMTVMSGHTTRRFHGRKKTWRNQDLGPFIGHEMNRCITCYRCTRFYHDYAGGKDLQAFGSRSRMYFGRTADGVLESEFAGNLVEVCPTGVFTDKPFSQSYSRKWDLGSAPSICPGCAVGCNISPGERFGRLKRIHNRYHGEVNGYFLCDRGRFGSHFVNAENRLRRCGVRVGDEEFQEIEGLEALAVLTDLAGGGNVVGIGSPRASIEDNFALMQLVGEDQFCAGFSSDEAVLNELIVDIYRSGAGRVPTPLEIENSDAVLVLGEDVLNSAPRLALSLRQSVRNESLRLAEGARIPLWQDAGVRGHAQGALSELFSLTVLPTGLDDIAAHVEHLPPEQIARHGHAIAQAVAGVGAEESASGRIAAALKSAKRPLIVSGTGCGDGEVMRAAAAVSSALRHAGSDPALLLTALEVNSLGATLLGGGLGLDEALKRLKNGAADNVIVLENDLYRRADPSLVDAALEASRRNGRVLVADLIETRTTANATHLIPVAAYAETLGTFVNLEGRAQRFYQVFEPRAPVTSAWQWLGEAGRAAGRNDMRWQHFDTVVETCASRPGLEALREVAPGADYRGAGGLRIPRETHRASGRTARNAHIDVHERKTPVDTESPFSFSMEGAQGGAVGSARSAVWAPGWNSNQSVFKFQDEVDGALIGGSSGIRLFEPAHGVPAPSYAMSQTSDEGEGFRLIPLHRIFGSDELSAMSPPVVERGGAAEVVLNRADAGRLGAREGDGIRCDLLSASAALRVDDAMAVGHAGLVVGETFGWLPRGRVVLSRDPDFRSSQELIARE